MAFGADHLTIQGYLSLRRVVESPDNMSQGRFSAPGGADDHQELIFINRKIQVVQHEKAVEAFTDLNFNFLFSFIKHAIILPRSIQGNFPSPAGKAAFQRGERLRSSRNRSTR